MKKNTLVIIFISIILLGGAGAVWYLTQQTRTQPTNDQQVTPTDTTPTPSQTDETQQTAGEQIVMKNSTFSPAKLTVKKGTTVTWINEDTMNHNVVASHPADSGGLPSSNPLLQKGETYAFTFNEVGTFDYHCVPHASFMKGVVEVIE